MGNQGFAVSHKKLADLTPDARNANKGTERGNAMIENSLRQYGAGRSILLDRNGRIIAGNKTAENAGSIGMNDVVVVQSDGTRLIAVQRMDLDLDSPQAKQLAIADNRAGQVSLDWDVDVLKELATEIDLAPFFSADELEKMWPQNAELLTDEDDVPPLPDEPVTKLGPKIQNDSMPDAEFKQFLVDAFTAMATVIKDGAAVYIAHADTEGVNFRSAFTESGFMLKQCLIWAKQQFVFGRSDYHWQHEPILYGWKAGAAHTFYGARNQGTLWNIDRPMRSEKEHPTQKPVALVEKAIANSSKSGDLLYEPFGGSGSTLIACEKTGRTARIMELDPKYCDVIVKRWEDATGKKAVLDGQAA